MQLNPKTFDIAARQSDLIKEGHTNRSTRYEVVKRDGMFVIELISHWIEHFTKVNPNRAEETITFNHRDVLCTVFPCMYQNKINAGPPHDVAGAVARCKALATQTGLGMSVNLPS